MAGHVEEEGGCWGVRKGRAVGGLMARPTANDVQARALIHLELQVVKSASPNKSRAPGNRRRNFIWNNKKMTPVMFVIINYECVGRYATHASINQTLLIQTENKIPLMSN